MPGLKEKIKQLLGSEQTYLRLRFLARDEETAAYFISAFKENWQNPDFILRQIEGVRLGEKDDNYLIIAGDRVVNLELEARSFAEFSYSSLNNHTFGVLLFPAEEISQDLTASVYQILDAHSPSRIMILLTGAEDIFKENLSDDEKRNWVGLMLRESLKKYNPDLKGELKEEYADSVENLFWVLNNLGKRKPELYLPNSVVFLEKIKNEHGMLGYDQFYISLFYSLVNQIPGMEYRYIAR
jgi:hypothetical protein